MKFWLFVLKATCVYAQIRTIELPTLNNPAHPTGIVTHTENPMMILKPGTTRSPEIDPRAARPATVTPPTNLGLGLTGRTPTKGVVPKNLREILSKDDMLRFDRDFIRHPWRGPTPSDMVDRLIDLEY